MPGKPDSPHIFGTDWLFLHTFTQKKKKTSTQGYTVMQLGALTALFLVSGLLSKVLIIQNCEIDLSWHNSLWFLI